MMKLKRLGRNISVLLLLGVLFSSTSIKELHYAFASATKYHAEVHHDNCDHHIHSTNKEDDCTICNLEVADLFQTSTPVYSFEVIFLSRTSISKPESLLLASEVHSIYLRGPPSIS